MRHYFEKNASFFEKKAVQPTPIDWSRPNVRVGLICLGSLEDVITSAAAGRTRLVDSFLAQAHRLISEAIVKFGAALERDEADLDRVAMSLASWLGHALSPSQFSDPWPVPFDAFPRYIQAGGAALEEQNAARVLWAILGIFEEKIGEYRAAHSLKLRVHRDFRDEVALLGRLEELRSTSEGPVWVEYERVLARWLNPTLETRSFASNFQNHIAAAMTLVWCKYHLRNSDKESVLSTYFGETLSVSVLVG
jgi:hypothetical protein